MSDHSAEIITDPFHARIVDITIETEDIAEFGNPHILIKQGDQEIKIPFPLAGTIAEAIDFGMKVRRPNAQYLHNRGALKRRKGH